MPVSSHSIRLLMTAVMAKQLGNLGVAGMRRPCQGRSMEIQPRNHFLLSEQDEELRAIVATEMQRPQNAGRKLRPARSLPARTSAKRGPGLPPQPREGVEHNSPFRHRANSSPRFIRTQVAGRLPASSGIDPNRHRLASARFLEACPHNASSRRSRRRCAGHSGRSQVELD